MYMFVIYTQQGQAADTHFFSFPGIFMTRTQGGAGDRAFGCWIGLLLGIPLTIVIKIRYVPDYIICRPLYHGILFNMIALRKHGCGHQ